MMGRQTVDQARLFYGFHLEERVPADHLLRRIDVFMAAALADLHREARGPLQSHRSAIDRSRAAHPHAPSSATATASARSGVCAKRSRARLTFRWFCRLDLDSEVP